MSELKYWLGFNIVKGIGPAKVQALLDHYGALSAAWAAPEPELTRLGIDRRALKTLRAGRARLDLDAEMAKIEAAGIQLLTWQMPEYPSYLKETPTPPPLLYVVGEMLEVDRFAVAVVGTRRLTSYGKQVTRDLVTGLVHNGVTVVSGLARGIDAVAHKTAVSLDGRTFAVLGSGLDCIYPAEHRQLAQKIREGKGALISEYGLGVRPEAKNFPPRNRIISGLSLGVIVVEAGERSGDLITTNFAVEQNRDVFAVPGNINSPVSAGPHKLIQQGAKLVTKVDDVLEELNLHMIAEKTAVQLALPESNEEVALYTHLSAQPIHIDELRRETGLTSSEVSSTLTLMELKGMVQQVGGMNYVLCREAEPVYELSSTQKDDVNLDDEPSNF